MDRKYLNVRGKMMYVEIHGENDAYPLLYLHGGPGESCYEFCYHQAKRLQKDFKLIAIDQRGVCRSQAIGDDEHFSIDDIVLDCEALREELGIKRWAVLGHSFGGYIALKYATMFPDSVSRIVFECPAFDFGLSSRSLLRKMAQIGKQENMEEFAKKCLELAQSDRSAKELMLKFIELRPELGEKGIQIHVHNPSYKTDYTYYTEEEWEQFSSVTNIHNCRLLDGEDMFDSILPKLKEMKQPSLLIRGQFDPVTCEKQLQYYQTNVSNCKVITFQYCGHFPHCEEPDAFSEAVVSFLK